MKAMDAARFVSLVQVTDYIKWVYAMITNWLGVDQ